jgi:hypothetical protein
MKKVLLVVYVVCASILFLSSCTPTIRFDLEPETEFAQHKIYIQQVADHRPVHERRGYKIFYVDSISDKDYANGFLNEFKGGLGDGLGEHFLLVTDPSAATFTLVVTVNHFYGEYSQTVKTVFWEYGTGLLLFIPRLVTDAISYVAFAGRVAIDFEISTNDGRTLKRSLDVTVTDDVPPYTRGSASTASRLSKAASKEITQIFTEVLREI